MRISTFLPHVEVFGGVRRFLELGNAWSGLGHRVTLFHPGGDPPAWLSYHGSVARLESASSAEADLAVCADPHTYRTFRAHPARLHLYYCVLEGDRGALQAARDREVILAANSSALKNALRRRSRRPVLDGIGGINLSQFHPDGSVRCPEPFRILVNGRRSRTRKGTDLILTVLRSLAGKTARFETVLFDSVGPANRQDPRPGAPLPPDARYVMNPTQEELVRLYQSSHVFVAAERRAGWCNTALEALACGCALVCTPSGTRDFARHGETAWVSRLRHPWILARGVRRLLEDDVLREKLARAGPVEASRWTWSSLAEKLLRQLTARP